jgi:hypothetical protein
MRFDAFIVVDLDSGELCATTDEPGAKSFDGDEFVFQDTIRSFTAPSFSVDVIGNSISEQGLKFSLLLDLTPGELFNQNRTIQGKRARCWIVGDDDSVYSAFDGQVSSVSFAADSPYIDFSCSSKQDIYNIDFPPANIFDEGRFFNRKIVNVVETGGYSNEIAILEPAILLEGAYGTPDNPILPSIVPISFSFPIDGGTYDPGGLWYFFEDSSSDNVIPIIYGTCRDVAANFIASYRWNISGNYYEEYFYALASHPVAGRTREGGSLRGFYNNFSAFASSIRTMRDGLGGYLSYFSFIIRYTNSDFQETVIPELSDFNPTNVYVDQVVGKLGPDGTPISGLGDVIYDMYSSLGSVPSNFVDWQSTLVSIKKLNAIDVGVVINDKSGPQTLGDILFSRLSNEFPFATGTIGGKYSIFSTSIPQDNRSVLSLEYGIQLLERVKIEQTPLNDIVNNIRIEYGASGASGGDNSNFILNKDNSGIARASYQRWGERPAVTFQMPDSQSSNSASFVANDLLMRRGGIRMVVEYKMTPESIIDIAPMSVVDITDEDVDIEEEKMIFTGFSWSDDLEFVKASFLSLKMI